MFPDNLNTAQKPVPSDQVQPGGEAKLPGIARLMLRHQLLDREALIEATEQSRRTDTPLLTYLSKNKFISSYEVARLTAETLGLPLMDLSAFNPDYAPGGLVSEKLMRSHRALPLYRRGNRLFLAMSDPTDQHIQQDIKFQTKLNVEPVVVVDEQLTAALNKALDTPNQVIEAILEEGLDNIEFQATDEALPGGRMDAEDAAVDAPVVRFVNRVLLDAINTGASDIHFEPFEDSYRVRYRQDGLLREITHPPLAMAPRITARLKIMSQLDISERRRPQDGRIRLRLSRRRKVDFRISFLPTLYGEKIVLRILETGESHVNIDALGLEDFQKQLYLDAIGRPQGMILVTGPTGSGKTVTLYSALAVLNQSEVNVSSVEDPVEINLPGVNQVNINPKAGLDFANVLRSFLRQDPDILMVGEIRDLETAEIAIKAAQTGHLVLSTLHTNDTPQTLNRLINMGVAPYNVASSVHLIMAQRLLRKLCQNCKTPIRIPEPELLNQGFRPDELEQLAIFKAVGCEQCTNGYRGRVGVFEMMPITESIGELMMRGANAMELAQQAKKEGLQTLRESGLNKVRLGITTLDEVHRIT